jgi:hypothetical protein
LALGVKHVLIGADLQHKILCISDIFYVQCATPQATLDIITALDQRKIRLQEQHEIQDIDYCMSLFEYIRKELEVVSRQAWRGPV